VIWEYFKVKKLEIWINAKFKVNIMYVDHSAGWHIQNDDDNDAYTKHATILYVVY